MPSSAAPPIAGATTRYGQLGNGSTNGSPRTGRGVRPGQLLRRRHALPQPQRRLDAPSPARCTPSRADKNAGNATSVWALGTNAVTGGCGIYQYVGGGSTWQPIAGGASGLTVDNTGNPWVLQSGFSNAIYRLIGGAWSNMPGAALEISAGAGGDVWVIGTNQVNACGHGLYRYVGAPGYWQAINGAADHIAVAPDNSLWVIQSNGAIYHYVSGGWTAIPGQRSRSAWAMTAAVYVIGTNADGGRLRPVQVRRRRQHLAGDRRRGDADRRRPVRASSGCTRAAACRACPTASAWALPSVRQHRSRCHRAPLRPRPPSHRRCCPRQRWAERRFRPPATACPPLRPARRGSPSGIVPLQPGGPRARDS